MKKKKKNKKAPLVERVSDKLANANKWILEHKRTLDFVKRMAETIISVLVASIPCAYLIKGGFLQTMRFNIIFISVLSTIFFLVLNTFFLYLSINKSHSVTRYIYMNLFIAAVMENIAFAINYLYGFKMVNWLILPYNCVYYMFDSSQTVSIMAFFAVTMINVIAVWIYRRKDFIL